MALVWSGAVPVAIMALISSSVSSLAGVPSSENLANVVPMCVQLLNNFLAFTWSLTYCSCDLKFSGAKF